MKAGEPRAPIVKFGMTTDESQRMVQHHFDLMDDRQAVAAGVLDHNLRTACIAKALLDGQPASEPLPMPVALPEAEPAPEVAPPIAAVTQRARPDNLRERLGLS
jgi:hypothetical protein